MNLDVIFNTVYSSMIKSAQTNPNWAISPNAMAFYMGYRDGRSGKPNNATLIVAGNPEFKTNLYNQGFKFGQEYTTDNSKNIYEPKYKEWLMVQLKNRNPAEVQPVGPVDPIEVKLESEPSKPAPAPQLPAVINFGPAKSVEEIFIERTAQVQNVGLERLRNAFLDYYRKVNQTFNTLHNMGTSSDESIRVVLGRNPANENERNDISQAIIQSSNVINNIIVKLNNGQIETSLLIAPESQMNIFKFPEAKKNEDRIMFKEYRIQLIQQLRNIFGIASKFNY